jgi:hypothetical protein
VIEYSIVRVFFNRDSFQVIADEMQPRDPSVQIVDHLHPLAAPEFRSMIRALVERHLWLDFVRRHTERVENRRAVRPEITIRNSINGA